MQVGEDLTKEVRKLFLLTFPSHPFTHPQEACLQRQVGGIQRQKTWTEVSGQPEWRWQSSWGASAGLGAPPSWSL